MKESAEYDKCAVQLKALADPTRLRILQSLFSGPSHVSSLCDQLNENIINVSHHLGVLRHAGLVQKERRGKYIIYSLPPDVVSKKQGRINLGCCHLDL